MKTAIILFLLFINNTFASYNESVNKLTAEEQKIINKANTYFNNLQTLQSNFYQYDDNSGKMAEGKLYIQKPKKLRFEYTHPFNTLLITNNNVTTYYDKDLDEISTFITKSLPISFLFNEKSNLESINAEIIKINKEDNKITIYTISIIDKNKFNINYTFDKNITNLQEINFQDENGQNITITLFNTQLNKELDKNLFIFKNPRLYKNRK